MYDVYSQAFIQLSAILLCAVTGTGEITDVLASHRECKKIPRITTGKHYPPVQALLQKTGTRTFISNLILKETSD